LLLLQEDTLGSKLALEERRVLGAEAACRGHDDGRLGTREPDLAARRLEEEILEVKVLRQKSGRLLLLLLR
jgi:EAL domain-containing protein (putative c-di-GMP-specific phosphodiesterase class I)